MDIFDDRPERDETGSNNVRVQKLLMLSAVLGKNISELWEAYCVLSDTVDLSDPVNAANVLDMVCELEYNLTEILGDVQEQLYRMSGLWEPLPHEEVEDFEASILRDIDKLDKVNLDDYRVEYYD